MLFDGLGHMSVLGYTKSDDTPISMFQDGRELGDFTSGGYE